LQNVAAGTHGRALLRSVEDLLHVLFGDAAALDLKSGVRCDEHSWRLVLPSCYLGTASSIASSRRFSSLCLGYRAERALASRRTPVRGRRFATHRVDSQYHLRAGSDASALGAALIKYADRLDPAPLPGTLRRSFAFGQLGRELPSRMLSVARGSPTIFLHHRRPPPPVGRGVVRCGVRVSVHQRPGVRRSPGLVFPPTG